MTASTPDSSEPFETERVNLQKGDVSLSAELEVVT